jgi:site-specific recombinase XerD
MKALKATNLPSTSLPMGLRHSLAPLLFQQRESLASVQRQFGHASIQLRVDSSAKRQWLG